MKKNSISKNYIYNLIYQLLIIFIPIILIPYLTRTFSTKTIGLYEYSYNIASYFVYFALFSTTIYANRKIAEYNDDKVVLSKHFWSIIFVKFFVCLLTILLYILIVLIFEFEHWSLFFLQAILIVSSGIDVSWLFVGIENFKLILLRNLSIKIFSLILILVFIKSEDQFPFFIIIMSSSELIGQILMWFSIYKNKFVERMNIDKTLVKENFIGLLKSFIPQIIIYTYAITSVYLLGNISSNEEVAYFAYSKKITLVIITIVTSLGAVIVPRISKFYFENKLNELKHLLSKSIDMMLFMALPMLTGLILVSTDLVTLFLGDPYIPMVPTFLIFSIRIFPQIIINFIIGQYIVPMYQNKKLILPHIIVNILFILMVLIIDNHSSFSFSIILLISDIILLILLSITIRKETNIFLIILKNWKLLLSSLTMFIVLHLFQINLKDNFMNSFLGTIQNSTIGLSIKLMVDIVIGVMVFSVMILILKPNQLRLVFETISNKLKTTQKS